MNHRYSWETIAEIVYPSFASPSNPHRFQTKAFPGTKGWLTHQTPLLQAHTSQGNYYPRWQTSLKALRIGKRDLHRCEMMAALVRGLNCTTDTVDVLEAKKQLTEYLVRRTRIFHEVRAQRNERLCGLNQRRIRQRYESFSRSTEEMASRVRMYKCISTDITDYCDGSNFLQSISYILFAWCQSRYTFQSKQLIRINIRPEGGIRSSAGPVLKMYVWFTHVT